jgi:hypothetical protein
MNICPTVNPGMLTVIGANYARFYGDRMKYLIALRSMLDAGLKPALASDYPSGPLGVHLLDGAVNRYDRGKQVQLDRTQSVTVLEAVRCSTLHGAYLSFEEDIKGSLEPGKLADMIVLTEDITSTPVERLNEIRVDLTMIDGKIEFRRDG